MEPIEKIECGKNAGNEFSYGNEVCPMCGSSEFVSGAMGSRCSECDYTEGFHGTQQFQNSDEE